MFTIEDVKLVDYGKSCNKFMNDRVYLVGQGIAILAEHEVDIQFPEDKEVEAMQCLKVLHENRDELMNDFTSALRPTLYAFRSTNGQSVLGRASIIDVVMKNMYGMLLDAKWAKYHKECHLEAIRSVLLCRFNCACLQVVMSGGSCSMEDIHPFVYSDNSSYRLWGQKHYRDAYSMHFIEFVIALGGIIGVTKKGKLAAEKHVTDKSIVLYDSEKKEVVCLGFRGDYARVRTVSVPPSEHDARSVYYNALCDRFQLSRCCRVGTLDTQQYQRSLANRAFNEFDNNFLVRPRSGPIDWLVAFIPASHLFSVFALFYYNLIDALGVQRCCNYIATDVTTAECVSNLSFGINEPYLSARIIIFMVRAIYGHLPGYDNARQMLDCYPSSKQLIGGPTFVTGCVRFSEKLVWHYSFYHMNSDSDQSNSQENALATARSDAVKRVNHMDIAYKKALSLIGGSGSSLVLPEAEKDDYRSSTIYTCNCFK